MKAFTDAIPAGPAGEPHKTWQEWVEALPVAQACGFRIASIEPGGCTVVMDSYEWPLNPSGGVHGGLVLAWADLCLGVAVKPVSPAGALPATIALSSQFLRPAVPPLTLVTSIERLGRYVAFGTVEVRDRDGDLAVVVSGSLSVDGNSRPPRSDP